jgi:cobalt-zinc-cadmium resistance protein CzcA
MVSRLIDFAMGNRGWILGAFGVALLLGGWSLYHLPVDAVPDITNVQVVVNSKTGALEPEKIEQQVTYPIETEMMGLPHIEEVRSLSKYGLSQVTAVFQDGTDIYWARQQVSERLQNARGVLPSKINPELAPMTTGLGEVFMYSVEAVAGSELAAQPEAERLLTLRTIQDYVIRPQLKKIPGVADIDSGGGYKKEIHINILPALLEKSGLTLDNVVARLESVGDRFGGGYIQTGGKQIILRTDAKLDTLDRLREIPLGLDVRGRPITVEQVSEVRLDHPLRLGAATRNGEETVLGTVLMRVGANSRQVAADAATQLRGLKLPDGAQAIAVYSRGYLVDKTVQTVGRNLLEGAFLVIAVLVLVLGQFRAAFLVALAIPVSMLFAARGMEWLGLSANLMSLGAIDFGLLVDGSIVVVENTLRRLGDKTQSEVSRLVLFRDAAKEVASPVLFGVCMILLVYVPILALGGVEGKMFRPMALTVVLALSGSLLVALVLMPVLGFYLLRAGDGGEAGWSQKPFLWLQAAYARLLRFSLNHRRVVLGFVVVVLVLAAAVFSRLGADFVPALDEADLVIGIARPASIAIDTSTQGQKLAEKLILEFGEVQEVFSRLGTPESATDPMGVHLADTFLILKKDRTQWPLVNGKPRTKEEFFEAVRARFAQKFPDDELSYTQPIEMRFNEILEGSRADVSLRILGPDLKQLMELSSQAQTVLKGIRGISSINQDALTALRRSPVLGLELDYGAINRYGLTIKAVNDALEMTMGGRELGSFFDQNVRFPIVLHLDESLRNSVDEIKKIPVSLPLGGSIPFGKLVKFQMEDAVTTISRSWGRRYAALAINIRGRDIGSFVDEAKQKLAGIALPPGVELHWGGQFKNLEQARGRLAVLIPATIAVVFLLLLRALGSFPVALLVFTSVPFAAVGGLFALYLRDLSLSISAAVGFIALIGIALLNSLVLVSFYRDPGAEKGDLKTAIEKATLTRFRPVLMTAAVAILGFIPMATSSGLGAEVQRPLATVVIGGLFSSTLLTLLILPTLYLWMRIDAKSKAVVLT